MRIITGKYKGRRFDVPRTFKARPTTDCAKENIFNVIRGYVDLDGARALDLFAGTGSISLEMLSRGCDTVVAVEIDREHHAFIRQCLAQIGDTRCLTLRCDAFRFIRKCRRQFDVIFADPPYTLDNIPDIPDMIFRRGMLAHDGLLVLEHGKHNDFAGHPRFVERRAYGSVNFSLFADAPMH